MDISDIKDDDVNNFNLTKEELEMINKYLPAMQKTIEDIGSQMIHIAGELTEEYPRELIVGMMGMVDRQFAETDVTVVPEILFAIKSVLELSMSMLENKVKDQ